MTADAWLTLAVFAAALVLLATERLPPALIMGAGVLFLLVAGVIDEEGAFSGFSNEAPITVAALYILAGAAETTGALDRLTSRALGEGPGDGGRGAERRHFARIMFPAAAASAFIANTPLVGMLAPRVIAWCRGTGRSASRYLMPLSYAVIFGGCISVMGTSTNLVVSGLLRKDGQDTLGLFEITAAGLPLAVVGVGLIVLLTPRLLPERRAPSDQLAEGFREFTIEMEVSAPLAGRSVEDAGLRNLQGVFLTAVERSGHPIAPVGPDEVLAEGDHLIFAGNVSRILDLQRMPGLSAAEDRHFRTAGADRLFYEAVVGHGALSGATLKEVNFRSRYGAAVMAIHRHGERIPRKLGQVRLRPGDVLLLMGDRRMGRRWRDHPDFLVLAPFTAHAPVRAEKAWIVQLLLLAMVVSVAVGLLTLLKASLLAVLALVGMRVITPADARRSVDFNVILLIGLSFGLAEAMRDSGLAEQVGRVVVAGFSPMGDVGLLAGVLMATMLMTELLSNNAAAALMFPIAMATAERVGMNPRPFALVVLFGASLSFLTPIGYQANTMVWGMGGYRYRDFARLGAPLSLATIVVTLLVVPAAYSLR